MTAWEVCHYVFPDDGGATFEGVIEAVPGSTLRDMEERPHAAWLLSVSRAEATPLLLAVSELGILLFADDTLFVPDAARLDCLTAMSQLSITNAEWHRVHGVEFRTRAARMAFEASVQCDA